jgi:hypothetical protein
MTILYMPDEKVPLKVEDVTIWVTQLTMAQKAAVIDKLSSGSPLSLLEASSMAVKYAVKGIEGVFLSSGKPFTPEFEGSHLADSSVEAILCLPQTEKIQAACFSLLRGLSNPLMDANGKPIPGVSIVESKPKKPAKN